MTASERVSKNKNPSPGRRTVAPRTPIGWWAIGLSVLALASWIILPLLTITFRDTYPITDTWLMPVTGLVITDTAAVLNILCVWLWRQRSVLNILALGFIIPVALFATFMVVGEGLSGV